MTSNLGLALLILFMVGAIVLLIVKNPEPFDPNDKDEL